MKRIASEDLNQHNWEEETASDQAIGTFQTASPITLQQRAILQPRTRLGAKQTAAPVYKIAQPTQPSAPLAFNFTRTDSPSVFTVPTAPTTVAAASSEAITTLARSIFSLNQSFITKLQSSPEGSDFSALCKEYIAYRTTFQLPVIPTKAVEKAPEIPTQATPVVVKIPNVTPPQPVKLETGFNFLSSGFKAIAKTGWTCSSCMVQNKTEDACCVSCEAVKNSPTVPSSAPTSAFGSSTGFNFSAAGFKPVEKKGWTCDSCMVSNKTEAKVCLSCESPNPTVAAPSFSFGGNNGAFSFKPPVAATNPFSATPAISPFTFGLPSVPSLVPSSKFQFTPQPAVATLTEVGDEGDADAMPILEQADLTQGEGEEKEETLYQIKAKLFVQDELKNWETFGTGILKIKKNESGACRILCRSDSGRVLVNSSIFKGMMVQNTSEKQLTTIMSITSALKVVLVRVGAAKGCSELFDSLSKAVSESI